MWSNLEVTCYQFSVLGFNYSEPKRFQEGKKLSKIMKSFAISFFYINFFFQIKNINDTKRSRFIDHDDETQIHVLSKAFLHVH